MRYWGISFWGRERWYRAVGIRIPFTGVTVEVHW